MFKVHESVMLRAAELNPSAYNPRAISPEKFEALKESIREHGFLEPLVVQKKGLKIIGGHQRLRACKELCVEAAKPVPDLPCTVLDVDDKTARKINIKLNKVQGEFEARLLGELLVDIYDDEKMPLPTDEFSLLGFAAQEAEKFIRLVEPERVPLSLPDGGEEPGSFGKSIMLSIAFETVALRDKVKKLLSANAKTTKQMTGQLVAVALGLSKKKPSKKRAA
jgi:hypothetical protein